MAIIRVATEDAHAFSIRVEFHPPENFKFYVFNLVPLGHSPCLAMSSWLLPPNLGKIVIAKEELKTMLLCEFDQCHLIRGGSLVKNFRSTICRLLGLWHALMSCTEEL